MQKRTRQLISGALSTEPSGLTRTDLIARTGLSPATISTAIQIMGLVPDRNVLPYRYSLPPVGTAAVSNGGTPVSLPLDIEPVDIDLAQWNSKNDALMRAVQTLELFPSSDPRVRIKTARDIAAVLLSFANTLEPLAEQPDWYTRATGG